MENQMIAASPRVHPLVAGAAVSVILVSLLGVAAITGVLPSSHGTAPSIASTYPSNEMPTGATNGPSPATQVDNGRPAAARYMTPDGRVLEVVPGTQRVAPVSQAQYVGSERAYEPAPVIHHHKPVRYSQNIYPERALVYQQQSYAPPEHPIQNYVSDMHPVGTGIGAVAGGLLGHQVGGGNGKKLATVAGVLLGGYAGNEIAHNRSPVPW